MSQHVSSVTLVKSCKGSEIFLANTGERQLGTTVVVEEVKLSSRDIEITYICLYK